MKHTFSRFILLLCSVINTPVQSQTWTQLLDFPGSARDDAAGFIIGNTFYVGTGLDGGFNAQLDFYKMDLQTETWSTGTSLNAGWERQYACGFSNANYGYIFGGIGPGATYLQDLIRFDPTNNSWQLMTSMPSQGRRGAACFVIGNDVFIVGGNNPSQANAREVWKYNITNDSWQQMNDIPFTGLWRAGAYSVNGVGYVLGGIDSSGAYSNKLYRYDSSNDQWNLLATFAGNGRAYTQLVPMGNNIMFFGGYENGNIYQDDLWMYDLTNNTFIPYNPIPSLARRGYVSCVWNNTIYISTGLNSIPARTAETWKVNGIVGIENLEPETFEVYPNPFTEYIQVNKSGHLEIFDVQGRKVYEEEIEKGKVNFNFLNAGFYILKLNTNENKLYSIKIYKLN
jgi:N-acetylneuraminic acid mutarotase